MENQGPERSVYNATKSGWFDSTTSEIRFIKVFLPNVSKLSGRKLLIGDNLSLHFSTIVINESMKPDIVFVTMLANAMHLCQLLDVAMFGPAKRSWRKILDRWRKETRLKRAIPKSVFPNLLKRLYDTLSPVNLKSGFQVTGISPIVNCITRIIPLKRSWERA